MTKKELEAERGRLLKAIDSLLNRIRKLEEQRNRDRVQIETLETTVTDLRKQLNDVERRLQ